MSNSIKDSAQAFAVNQVLKYVDSNPQEAFPKFVRLVRISSIRITSISHSASKSVR